MAAKVLLCLLWILYGALVQSCPMEENIAPLCMCMRFGGEFMMTCSNIMNADELVSPVRSTEGFDIFSINIEQSSLLYIPSGIFKGTKFKKIRFENSQVMSLSDTDVAFEGLEDHLEEIRATSAHYITTWDWSQLHNLKKIDLIDVTNIAMYSLDNEFPHLHSLTALGIIKAEISFIHPNAFQGLENLKLLVLKENEISEFKRDMLPSPANALFHLDLSNNQLVSLPENMFQRMPSLREVYLSNNKLVTLKEETFSGIFDRSETLMLKGNMFQCDCRLRWLVGHKIPLHFEGNCHSPEHLKEHTLQYLKNHDLWC